MSAASVSRMGFRATREAEARVLLLIDGFSRDASGFRTLEGRVKLAKLDFFLRYPHHLATVLRSRGAKPAALDELEEQSSPIESRMMRYRYGPWDPSHFAILGSLIGRGLVEVIPAQGTSTLGYRTTPRGEELSQLLVDDGCLDEVVERIHLLRRHLDLTGSNLKNLAYDLAAVSDTPWRKEIE